MSKQDNINLESMLRVGTVLHGTYRIDGYLSSGGFGNTYVATHINFNEKYAIKEFFMKGVNERDGNNTAVSVSNNEKVTEFTEQLEKFKKEARRLRKLNNPHIVRVYDLFEENGTAYYVMDFINGENLKEKLKRLGQPINESESTEILIQVLDALQEVHSQGIWHLDLKPANVMLDDKGTVKVIDFGASKQFNSKTGGALSTSSVTYTNGYAPIEQMEKSYEKLGPWTDFYALGATIYNILSNERPPMPSDINDDHTPNKRLSLPLPDSVSDKMRDLILWMMKTNRKERPATVQDIADYMKAGAMGSYGDAESTILETRAIPKDQAAEDVVQVDSYDNDDSTQNTQKTKKAIFIAACAGLLLAVGGFFLFNGGGNEHKQEAGQETIAVDTVKTVTQQMMTITLGECKYTGSVNEAGVPDGKGYAVFANGDSVNGSFVKGDVEGDNITYYFKENGDTYLGSFKKNHFTTGRLTQKDGTYFEGSFDNDYLPAKGKWYSKDGKPIQVN